MHQCTSARPWRQFFAVVAVVAVATTPFATVAQAQTGTPPVRDSVARADSSQRIEGVIVSAIRAGDQAPISQKTIQREVIAQRQFGQDVPLLLQGASPSLTAHTETGTNWGYSYLRLRGLDQTRINITIDGIPLNDMEDQVLYFANFADLMSNVQSVQIQRGVGTSTAGTASFAGSINFETTPVALKDPSAGAEVQLGSFGAQRVSGAFHSGLTDSRFAAYGRVSAQRTNGYRDHSGVLGRSAYLGAGWFGDRTIVKATALVGLLADTLSYTGATRSELATNRRYNPLAPDELDKFGQQLFALSMSNALTPNATLSTTVYRNSASGNYDYFYFYDGGEERYRYGLEHEWYGATSAVNVERANVQFNAGVNVNTYERAHRAFLRPDLHTPLYDNTGHKQDASAFAKASLDLGRVQYFADLQTRWAKFRYSPDDHAGIGERSTDWTFFNPKVGATVRLNDGWQAYASYGATTREPTRSDLFAGDDDLNTSNIGDYGDFTRVKPESVRDAELGVRWVVRGWGQGQRQGQGRRRSFQANVYSMDFKNDIARIGAPTASGAILRRNVGASYRRGLELDGDWQLSARLTVGGNATVSTNRIKQFTDSSRDTPVVLTDVEPVLTPQLLSAQRIEFAATPRLTFIAEGRYQSKAYLDNTGSADRTLPDFYVLDASARANWSRYTLVVRGSNLGDTQKFGSGSVGGSGTVRYFVLPARAVFVTLGAAF